MNQESGYSALVSGLEIKNHALFEITFGPGDEEVMLAWFGGSKPVAGTNYVLRATEVVEKDGSTHVGLVLVPAN